MAEDWLPVAGVRLAATAAGIRYKDRDDLVVMELAEGSTSAAVFTTNAFRAAPVRVAEEHLAAIAPRYLLINAGNANAGTGENGLRACRETCRHLAAGAGCAMNQILPFSTGVIGEDLPDEPFARAVPGLLAELDEQNWPRVARAIMTTDTVPKLVSRRVEIDGKPVTVTGIAKGAGMIHPNMATMLAYVATDAAVAKPVLQAMLQQAADQSFNAITIDGDTSTNDACVLVATAQAGVRVEQTDGPLADAVNQVCAELARAIVKDGEGATKLVSIRVEGATSADEARRVADTVALSPLVKTALFASDPNWGRILAAVGRAGVLELDVDGIEIWLDQVRIVSGGGRDPGYREEDGQSVVDQDEFEIRISLGRGEASCRVLTCDFSFDYVKINAEYRS